MDNNIISYRHKNQGRVELEAFGRGSGQRQIVASDENPKILELDAGVILFKVNGEENNVDEQPNTEKQDIW